MPILNHDPDADHNTTKRADSRTKCHAAVTLSLDFWGPVSGCNPRKIGREMEQPLKGHGMLV